MYLILSMGKISRIVASLLTLTIIMSCLTLLTVKPADAQSIPKPAIPEFNAVVKSIQLTKYPA